MQTSLHGEKEYKFKKHFEFTTITYGNTCKDVLFWGSYYRENTFNLYK